MENTFRIQALISRAVEMVPVHSPINIRMVVKKCSDLFLICVS